MNPVLRRGFKAEAERISINCRTEMGLPEHAPLPALELATHLNVHILTPEDIPGITADLKNILLVKAKNQWSAAIYNKDGKKYIIHNPTHSIYRQESNLMHELAHALCEHDLKDLETALTGCVIPLRSYDVIQEAEAECLGACLQLPQKALFHYHHILQKTDDEISKIFNASKQMVQFRMRKTGVLKIRFRK